MYLMELIENEITEIGAWNIDDVELHSDKCGVDVYIGWHTPSTNLDYYPIVQVNDDDGNIIKWKEGPENDDKWLGWIEEVLAEYNETDDWWYIR